jgi:hypothetical protein
MEFRKEDERILAKVVTSSFTNIQEGELVILRRINNRYYHPDNCYADSVLTGKWLGRYPTKAFEVLRTLEGNENIHELITTEENQQEQLALF